MVFLIFLKLKYKHCIGQNSILEVEKSSYMILMSIFRISVLFEHSTFYLSSFKAADSISNFYAVYINQDNHETNYSILLFE